MKNREGMRSKNIRGFKS